jgi:hypothetical protein
MIKIKTCIGPIRQKPAANLHTKICLKKDKILKICYLFQKKIMLARALIGNWQYFVMGYHENIFFPNAGKILTVYIILKELIFFAVYNAKNILIF